MLALALALALAPVPWWTLKTLLLAAPRPSGLSGWCSGTGVDDVYLSTTATATATTATATAVLPRLLPRKQQR